MEGKTGEPEDRARHLFFQGLERALAEYLLCELVATQQMIKDYFPTTWSGCCCIFLTAVSSSDFFLCDICGLHTSKQGNSAHKWSKEEICLIPAFGQGLLGQAAFPGAGMVTSGENPQTGEVQHYLASTWVPQTGSVWWRGREHHPATGWLLHHVRRSRYPTEPCGGKRTRSSSLPRKSASTLTVPLQRGRTKPWHHWHQ